MKRRAHTLGFAVAGTLSPNKCDEGPKVAAASEFITQPNVAGLIYVAGILLRDTAHRKSSHTPRAHIWAPLAGFSKNSLITELA